MTTTVQRDHDAILAAICAEPLDPLHRAAICDYWEEKGDALRLEAWRALEGKFPNEENDPGDQELSVTYWWYTMEEGKYSTWERMPETSRLDGERWVSEMLDDSTSSGYPSTCMWFRTPARAFTEAVETYVRLRVWGLF